MSRLSSILAKLLIIPMALVLPLTACASQPAAPAASVVSTATAAGSPTSATGLAVKKYTMTTVKKHHTAASCWTVVGKNVYNLTKWVKKHPGGARRILAMCGKNATKAFRAQHGTTGKAAKILATYKIGVLA